MRIALSLALGTLLTATGLQAQQNPLISQYMYNGLTLNPAYAGSQHRYSVALTYRNQWTGVQGAPKHTLLTMHMPLFKNRVGVGISINRQTIGVHANNNLYAQLAYKVRLANGFLSMGIAAGGTDRNSAYEQLLLTEQEDPFFTNTDYFAPNVGVGFYYYTKQGYVGLSAPQILSKQNVPLPKGKIAVWKTPTTLYLNAGTVLGQKQTAKFYPSILYRLPGLSGFQTSTLDINTNLILYDTIMVGASYRINTAIVLLSYLIINDNLRLTYSYDLFLNKQLSEKTKATHEIMINYRITVFNVRQRCSAYF